CRHARSLHDALPMCPRVWSAACASGEEPLSLAMLLAAHGLLEKIDLVASDLSPRALERAERGTYSSRSLRSPEAEALARPWLQRSEEHTSELHSREK